MDTGESATTAMLTQVTVKERILVSLHTTVTEPTYISHGDSGNGQGKDTGEPAY